VAASASAGNTLFFFLWQCFSPISTANLSREPMQNHVAFFCCKTATNSGWLGCTRAPTLARVAERRRLHFWCPQHHLALRHVAGLKVDYPELSDPTDMFDMSFFLHNQRFVAVT
jgi:hypothetical protein